MEPGPWRWTKLSIGLLFPAALMLLGAIQGFRVAIEDQDWILGLFVLPMDAWVVGPFFMYYWLIKTPEVGLFVGALLVLGTLWAIYGMFTSNSSTAALIIWWIPFFGYPLVLIAMAIERSSTGGNGA